MERVFSLFFDRLQGNWADAFFFSFCALALCALTALFWLMLGSGHLVSAPSGNQPEPDSREMNQTRGPSVPEAESSGGSRAAFAVPSRVAPTEAGTTSPLPSGQRWNYRFKDQRSAAETFHLGLYHAYQSRPADADDLTRLEGIVSGTAAKLNALGIYKSRQLRELSDDQLRRLAGYLNVGEETALRWKHAPIPSGHDEAVPVWPRLPSEEEIRERAGQLAQWRQDQGITASPEDDWILAERELFVQACGHGLNIDRKACYAAGKQRDPLPGMPEPLAHELSRLGYPSLAALAAMSATDRRQVERWLKARGWEWNLSSAATTSAAATTESEPALPPSSSHEGPDLERVVREEFAGEDVEIRPPFGILYKTPPALQDNLQDIYGVGPILEKKLHEFGVYRFKQIANWTSEAIEEFQEELSFPDRIRRDDWVGQCLRFIGESSSRSPVKKS